MIFGQTLADRQGEIFTAHYHKLSRRIDRLFSLLLTLQWLIASALALWVSPQVWQGHAEVIQLNFWLGVLGGGLLVADVKLKTFEKPVSNSDSSIPETCDQTL